MNHKRFKYILLSICLMTLSCSIFSSGDSDDQEQQSLVDTQWELVSFKVTEQGTLDGTIEPGVYEIPDEEDYILEFMGESGVRGTFFCNSCVANYKIIPPDSISITEMGCTRAVCGFSNAIIDRVKYSKTFELTQDNLILHYEADRFDGWHEKGNLYFKKMDME